MFRELCDVIEHVLSCFNRVAFSCHVSALAITYIVWIRPPGGRPAKCDVWSMLLWHWRCEMHNGNRNVYRLQYGPETSCVHCRYYRRTIWMISLFNYSRLQYSSVNRDKFSLTSKICETEILCHRTCYRIVSPDWVEVGRRNNISRRRIFCRHWKLSGVG